MIFAVVQLIVPSASLAPVPGSRASSVQARSSSLSAACREMPSAAADQLAQHAELGGRDPRLGGRPAAQQADEPIIGGAVAPPLRAGQLIEPGDQRGPGRAGVPGAFLREIPQPQARHPRSGSKVAGQPGAADGLFAHPVSGHRRLRHAITCLALCYCYIEF